MQLSPQKMRPQQFRKKNNFAHLFEFLVYWTLVREWNGPITFNKTTGKRSNAFCKSRASIMSCLLTLTYISPLIDSAIWSKFSFLTLKGAYRSTKILHIFEFISATLHPKVWSFCIGKLLTISEKWLFSFFYFDKFKHVLSISKNQNWKIGNFEKRKRVDFI